MTQTDEQLAQFSRLLQEGRPQEAWLLFLEQTEGKSFGAVVDSEAPMLDMTCQRVLPQLLATHTLWMVHHPARLRRMLELLTGALAAGYHRPATLDQIAWLRCLLAVSEAMAGRPERVHEVLGLADPGADAPGVPPPNGAFRQRIQGLEATAGALSAFLQPFFSAYVEYLRRAGRHELANDLERRFGRLVADIARDETRAGVVQALLHAAGQGYSRFVHVSIDLAPAERPEGAAEEGIAYVGAADQIDPPMREAAACARRSADALLRQSGYPDGLEGRLVRWEIATLQGEPADLPRQFEGGSIALALAVAIVSQYLARPVPNDVACTGALSATAAEEGRVLPVDAVPVKVQHALEAGARLLYVPIGNQAELDERPALRHLAAEHQARLVPVERLSQVCARLFPPEGSGRLSGVVGDTLGGLLSLIVPHWGARSRPSGAVAAGVAPAHVRHRLHVLTCSLLTAAIVLVEGWMVHQTFAPGGPLLPAWERTLAATVVASVAMALSLVLPGACLRHRQSWAWLAGIGLLALGCGGALALLWPVLPVKSAINQAVFTVPRATIAKDFFVIWVFMWALGANTFCVVASVEHLAQRRQFITARTCLRWDSAWEGRMPIRCVYFPWYAGTALVIAIALALIIWEWCYYSYLRPEEPGAAPMMLFGVIRQLVFLGAIAEVMLFYQSALAKVRVGLG